MFKTRAKTCAGRCRFGHPARKQSPRRRGVGMFRRDKRPLSGALHRFAFDVLKHRPRSGVGVIMSRAGAWVSRPPGQAKAAPASNPPGHRWRRASPALDHATGQAVATSSRTRSAGHQAGQQRRQRRGHGEPLSRPFPGRSIAGRGRAALGTKQRDRASVCPPAPARAKGKASKQGQGMGQRQAFECAGCM